MMAMITLEWSLGQFAFPEQYVPSMYDCFSKEMPLIFTY